MEAKGMSLEGYEQLKLEKQLCFPLYAAAKELVRKYKPYLDELNLTYTQYITMMVLWEYQSMNVKELGSRLYLDSGTLTPLLKKLEAKGYITRCRCKEDERNLIICITEEGEALKEKAANIPSEMAEKWLNLSKEEIQVTYHALYRLLSQV
jgi:DNA-binding MarR family transcriptional regulator